MSSIIFLDDSTLDELSKIFKQFSQIKHVTLYGSRVKGTHTNRSDIDLVISQSTLSNSTLSSIQLEIDNSDIPNLVEIQHFDSIQNEELKEHILNEGIVIYEK